MRRRRPRGAWSWAAITEPALRGLHPTMRSLPLSVSTAALLVLLGGTSAAGYWLGGAQRVADARPFTCSMHPQVRQAGAGVCPICRMELVPLDAEQKDQGPNQGHSLRIDPVLQQNSGVRVEQVARGELAAELRLFGTVQVASDHLRDITLKFGGFVEHLHASRDGMAIAK